MAVKTCAVLTCARLSQILQNNGQVIQVIDKVMQQMPWVETTAANGTVTRSMAGLNAAQIEGALQKVGISAKAQVQSDLTTLLNQVRAGNPVIAGVYTSATKTTANLHAVVIEGLETQGEVLGIKAYDPVGYDYWQPVETFAKYFSKDFVHPL